MDTNRHPAFPKDRATRYADCDRCGERFHDGDIDRHLTDVEVEKDGEIEVEMRCQRCLAHPKTP